MIEHHAIAPLSTEWIIYNSITLTMIVFVIFLGRRLHNNGRHYLTLGLSILFIIEFVGMEIFHYNKGFWFIEDSLPLHMCAIMWFVTIYLFLSKSQWAFELMLFIGMPGGIHSLLTPELTHGITLLDKIDYFLAHGGLVMAPFYAIFVMNMWPRKNAIWRSFLIIHIIALTVGIVNWAVGGNYMYLASRPIVDNPLIPPPSVIFGQWPYYIIIFQLALLAHALLVSLPFGLIEKKPLMKRLFTYLFFLIHVTHYGQQISTSIMHDNMQRDYILYVPSSYDPTVSMPLVFGFHGYTSNALVNLTYTRLKNIADTAGFIVVHPQGSLNSIGNTHWNVGLPGSSSVDDVGFTNALMDTLISQYNIDQSRIYACGMSNGGYMSFLLGCQLSHRVAAIASITGSMTLSTFNNCNPQRPVPVLQIHGTQDSTVPYNGNVTWSKSIDDVIQYWVNFNNCNATPTVTNLPDLVSTDGSTVIHYEYSGGNNGSEVVHFKVIDGGHDWPGVWGNLDIDASIEIWRFFSKFNLNGPVSTSISSIEKDAFTLYPRISDAQIVIKSDREEPFDIYDLSGKHIVHGVLKNGEKIISVQSYAKGTYIVVTNYHKEKFFVQ